VTLPNHCAAVISRVLLAFTLVKLDDLGYRFVQPRGPSSTTLPDQILEPLCVLEFRPRFNALSPLMIPVRDLRGFIAPL